jgi:3-(3-hydroxy-phenyl)propionate hydroxylase
VVDARARFAAPVWPGVHQVADPHRAATFLPLPGGRYRWEFRVRPGETAEQLAEPGRLAALLAPFGAADVRVERAAGYTYRAQVADRWRDRRVLLAGDAAHLTPPFIGQGLGLGLRDVHQLAWKLAAVLDGADDALLDTHQAERAPHARTLVRVALLLGRLMTGGGRAAAAVRTALLAGARRVPAVAALAVSARTPPLRRGPLVDRRGRSGRRLAGALVPQPAVRVAGRECRLDDVLGPGAAEVVAPPGGGPAVRRLPGGEWVAVEDPGGVLRGWLGGARGVVVRPDRVVRAVLR